jgi:hypothetical protein
VTADAVDMKLMKLLRDIGVHAADRSTGTSGNVILVNRFTALALIALLVCAYAVKMKVNSTWRGWNRNLGDEHWLPTRSAPKFKD